MNRLKNSGGFRYAVFKAVLSIVFGYALLPFTLSANGTGESGAVDISRLVADQDGILHLHAGDDGKDAVDLASELAQSIESGYFVIVVMTNDRYEEQAIAHGKKLQAWFEEQISTRDHVPLVVHKSERGVGYIYELWGGPYYHDEHAKMPHGVMTVQGSVAVLDHARIAHIARRNLKWEWEREGRPNPVLERTTED